MADWFTAERLDDATWALSEYGHWEEPHSYLLLGSARAALIDTGLGVADIRAAVEAITDLPVTVLTTHAHWDHIGGHGRFADWAVHEAEAGWMDGGFPRTPEQVRANLTREPCAFPPDFRPETYRVFQGRPPRLLHDGDRVELGGRTLEVLHTPGHSPGHCCFFEAARGDLFAGDLLYAGCLDAFYPTTDPAAFRTSIHRVQALPVRRVLPGHHDLELPADLIDRAASAFDGLAQAGKLRQGSGIFDFGIFQIHL